MSTPIIKSSTDEISVTASFSDFEPGKDYRIGCGTAGPNFQAAKFFLTKDGSKWTRSLESYDQGFTSSWFEVDKVNSQGYILASSDLPGSGERLTFKITLDRNEAENLGKFYMFIARKYGPDTWYVIDGYEINKKHW